MALFILQKYYRLSQAVPAYTAAALLDPSKRKTWDLPDMRRVISQMQDIWDMEYKGLSIPNEPRAQDSQSQTQRKKGKQKKTKALRRNS
jgi:hypothetical protein